MLGWASWRNLAKCCFALAWIGQIGCLSCCHPISPPLPDEMVDWMHVGQCQKNKVYAFIIHGCDPLDYSNLEGMKDYLNSIGYVKTYYGNSYHVFHFDRELCRLKREQPDAHVVLIGFGRGAGMARDLACSVRGDGITIDLLVYLDGKECDGRPLHRPSNVCRVVNVLSCKRADAELIDADNHLFEDVGHHGIPSHKRTLCLLGRELSAVAQTVPVVHPVMPEGMPTLPAPTPTLPAPKEISKGVNEWSFLKADSFAVEPVGKPPMQQALDAVPATTPRPTSGLFNP